MDLISLIALTTAAGFALDRFFGAGGKNTYPHANPTKSSPARLSVGGVAAESTPIVALPEYELIRDLVNAKSPVIFLTGSAGNGKSTFIKWIGKEFEGRMLLAAPTGMAAILMAVGLVLVDPPVLHVDSLPGGVRIRY